MSGVGTTAGRRPLLGSFEASSSTPRAWSPRRTLGFVMLTCGGFWAAALALILR